MSPSIVKCPLRAKSFPGKNFLPEARVLMINDTQVKVPFIQLNELLGILWMG